MNERRDTGQDEGQDEWRLLRSYVEEGSEQAFGRVISGFIPPDTSAIFTAALRREEKVVAPPKGTPWPKAEPLPLMEPPAALTVDLSHGPNGSPSTVRLSGPTSLVLRRLNRVGAAEPHRAKKRKVRKQRLK